MNPFEVHSFTLSATKSETITAELYKPAAAKCVYVLAHGAGANMHHAFMKELAAELAPWRIATLRYNFLYTEQKKKRPDFPAVAHQAVAAAIEKAHALFPALPVIAGGKSFGGRMTSQFLSDHPLPYVKGIAFVGFPLHPAGKPSTERANHLKKITLPMLFLQGSRDALAEWTLLEGVCNHLPSATLVRYEGADHSFKAAGQKLIPILAANLSRWVDSLA